MRKLMIVKKGYWKIDSFYYAHVHYFEPSQNHSLLYPCHATIHRFDGVPIQDPIGKKMQYDVLFGEGACHHCNLTEFIGYKDPNSK